MTQFVNPQGLNLLGGSIYTETDASGPPVDQPSRARTARERSLQGFLEASNVDPVKELVTLIKTQRSFELNSQSIQTADQALQTIGNLRRGLMHGNCGREPSDMEVTMNRRPPAFGIKIADRLTALAWATQTLFHQWGLGQEVQRPIQRCGEQRGGGAAEKFVPQSANGQRRRNAGTSRRRRRYTARRFISSNCAGGRIRMRRFSRRWRIWWSRGSKKGETSRR